jgi:formate/nitrite transporter FocA (FNT family)
MTKSSGLDQHQREKAGVLTSPKPSVIYEAIRSEGEHELSRPFSALWWSGVAAGLAISTSVMCKGFLVAVLPPDAAWAPAVSSFGYAVGFLIVILGRMQLFTENTITPVLSLFLAPRREGFVRTARLWGIVFAANMVGCAVAAALFAYGRIVPPAQLAGIMKVATDYAEITALEHLVWGMPAGFLVASLVWVLPRLQGAGEVMAIVIVTYMIGLGGLSHVVAGSTGLFLAVMAGALGPVDALLTGTLPSLVGNVVGGTGMFAALTYAQLREEL